MQNNLSLTLRQIDDAGEMLSRRVFAASDTAPVVGEWRSGLLVSTGSVSISLPYTQIRQCLVRNTHGSAVITVGWTPTTGASGPVVVLGPSDCISFWNQNTGATYGISALTLTSTVLNADYELFLGG